VPALSTDKLASSGYGAWSTVQYSTVRYVLLCSTCTCQRKTCLRVHGQLTTPAGAQQRDHTGCHAGDHAGDHTG
jgi:hypothetical protein